jgi:uncharacterized protein
MRIERQVCAAKVSPQRWRNGGGWTRVLLTQPALEPDWQLRVSLATIDAAGAFSPFPGVRRVLTVVSGAGLRLTVDGREHRLSVDSEPLHFDGGAAAHATPLAGPTTDLNLMTTRGSAQMLRATGGLCWSAAFAQRGIYCAVDGVLDAGDGAPEPVGAHTLLWLTEVASLPLRFLPNAPGVATPAWWLGFSPPA